MFDFKGCFELIKTATIESAKAAHKPRLQSKASMEAYAKAVGASGKKAVFTIQQMADAIEFVI